MTINPIQDVVDISLSAEKTIVNDTVKIVATITAQVQKDEPPDALPGRVRSMMNKVIDLSKVEKGGWNFSNMQRTKDDTGYERVTLTATARVPETENYNLEFRAEGASQPGLVINEIQADTTIPTYMIEEAVSELRVILATKAVEEARKISEALGRTYRIQRLNFGGGDYGGAKGLRTSNTMAASTMSYGTGSGDDGTLGNAQKVSLSATIALATLVDLPPSYIDAVWKPSA